MFLFLVPIQFGSCDSDSNHWVVMIVFSVAWIFKYWFPHNIIFSSSSKLRLTGSFVLWQRCESSPFCCLLNGRTDVSTWLLWFSLMKRLKLSISILNQVPKLNEMIILSIFSILLLFYPLGQGTARYIYSLPKTRKQKNLRFVRTEQLDIFVI